MPPAGTLEIDASLNSGNLDAGVARSKQKLKELGDTANSVDVETGKLGKTLGGIGRLAAAGATAAAGLFGVVAAKAPATAASRARLDVTVGKFIRETGEDIAPGVEELVSFIEKIQQFFAGDPLINFGERGEEKRAERTENLNSFVKNDIIGTIQKIIGFFGGRKFREARNEADLN